MLATKFVEDNLRQFPRHKPTAEIRICAELKIRVRAKRARVCLKPLINRPWTNNTRGPRFRILCVGSVSSPEVSTLALNVNQFRVKVSQSVSQPQSVSRVFGLSFRIIYQQFIHEASLRIK